MFRTAGGTQRSPALLALAVVGLVGCDVLGLGSEKEEVHLEPIEAAPGQRFTQVGAGWLHTCATGTSGGVYCWGKGEIGEIGPPPTTICRDTPFGDVPCTGVPQRVPGAPPLHSLGGGLNHTCGLDAQGVAWCWGLHGFLGDGVRHADPAADTVPCEGPPEMGLTCRASAKPVSGDTRFTTLQLAVEGRSSCGVAADGSGWCWGSGGAAFLGMEGSLVPSPLPSTLSFQALVVQPNFGCGLTQGAGWCWGSNWYGTLGNGSEDFGTTSAPVAVAGGHTFTQLAGTPSSMCGLQPAGAAVCWGHLPSFRADSSHHPYGRSPAPAGGPDFASIYGGGSHHCGLTAGGEAWCWGDNYVGALGDGSRSDQTVPVQVKAPAGVRFTQLALGGSHTCGLATDGRLFCWGSNSMGQLGRAPSRRGR